MTTRRRQQTELGRRIVDLRGNVTQEEIAARAGLSQALIQALEQGVRANPTLDTLRRLATALGVSVAELIGKEQDEILPK